MKAYKTSDVRKIRELWVRGKSMRHIAREIGVSHQSVARVVNREREALEPRRQETVTAMVEHFIESFRGMSNYQHISKALKSKGD